jgi:hypothetical protein
VFLVVVALFRKNTKLAMTDNTGKSSRSIHKQQALAHALKLSPTINPAEPLIYSGVDATKFEIPFDDAKKKLFLASLAEFPSVSAALRAANVSRATAYAHRYEDSDFGKAWDLALEIGYGILEDEAVRRAVLGIQEPIYHKGEIVGYVNRYSDTLLAFLLKGRRREVFGDKANENNEDTSVTIRVIGGLPDA